MRSKAQPPSVQLGVLLDLWASAYVSFCDETLSHGADNTRGNRDPLGSTFLGGLQANQNHCLISGPQKIHVVSASPRKHAFLSTDSSFFCPFFGRKVREQWKLNFCSMLSRRRAWRTGKRPEKSYRIKFFRLLAIVEVWCQKKKSVFRY